MEMKLKTCATNLANSNDAIYKFINGYPITNQKCIASELESDLKIIDDAFHVVKFFNNKKNIVEFLKELDEKGAIFLI